MPNHMTKKKNASTEKSTLDMSSKGPSIKKEDVNSDNELSIICPICDDNCTCTNASSFEAKQIAKPPTVSMQKHKTPVAKVVKLKSTQKLNPSEKKKELPSKKGLNQMKFQNLSTTETNINSKKNFKKKRQRVCYHASDEDEDDKEFIKNILHENEMTYFIKPGASMSVNFADEDELSDCASTASITICRVADFDASLYTEDSDVLSSSSSSCSEDEMEQSTDFLHIPRSSSAQFLNARQSYDVPSIFQNQSDKYPFDDFRAFSTPPTLLHNSAGAWSYEKQAPLSLMSTYSSPFGYLKKYRPSESALPASQNTNNNNNHDSRLELEKQALIEKITSIVGENYEKTSSLIHVSVTQAPCEESLSEQDVMISYDSSNSNYEEADFSEEEELILDPVLTSYLHEDLINSFLTDDSDFEESSLRKKRRRKDEVPECLDRWERIPIGTFRRSRRPSAPDFFTGELWQNHKSRTDAFDYYRYKNSESVVQLAPEAILGSQSSNPSKIKKDECPKITTPQVFKECVETLRHELNRKENSISSCSDEHDYEDMLSYSENETDFFPIPKNTEDLAGVWNNMFSVLDPFKAV